MPQQTDNSALPIRNSWSVAMREAAGLVPGEWVLVSGQRDVSRRCPVLRGIDRHCDASQRLRKSWPPPPAFDAAAADASDGDIGHGLT